MATQTGNFGPIIETAFNPSATAVTAVRAFNGTGVDASSIFKVPVSGTVTKLVFVSTLWSFGTATITGGLFTVDSAGLPTTTAYGGMAVGTVSVGGNGAFTITLATPASVTAGDIVAAKFTYSSGTGVFSYAGYQTGNGNIGFPYAYSSTKRAVFPITGIEYSGGVYNCIPGLSTIVSQTTDAFNSGSSPNEYGVQFQSNVDATVYGAAIDINVAANATFDVVLYSPSSVALATKSIDPDILSANGTQGKLMVEFDTPVTISGQSNYILAVKPTSANNVTLPTLQYMSQAAKDQALIGSTTMKVSRTGTGAWTSVVADAPQITPMFSATNDFSNISINLTESVSSTELRVNNPNKMLSESMFFSDLTIVRLSSGKVLLERIKLSDWLSIRRERRYSDPSRWTGE
jgi:hypothetical protein